MTLDIQNANMWKRISAGLFDGILLGILSVCFALILSAVLGYDSYHETVEAAYAKYEAQYGVSFQITQEEFDTLSQEELERYTAASEALSADREAMYAYNMSLQLTLVITIVAILSGHLVLEFAVPMLFKNGQTLGKKIFGIALMTKDCVKINAVSLFIRTLLGKYTIEAMIPIFIVLMIFMGTIGILGPILLSAIGLLQLILLACKRSRPLIHDLLANTVVVDMSSQMIFDSRDALIEYQKKRHAEQVSKQVY